MSPRLPSYLRTHRRRWALTQRELAELLGTKSSTQVSRYERLSRKPKLSVVLACQVIFGVPPDKMFPKLFATIEEDVIRKAYDLYRRLNGGSTRAAQRKLKLITDMLHRARNAANDKEV